MRIPKISPAHLYNTQAHAEAVADEETQLAQHRALMKMAAGQPAPSPVAPPPLVAPVPAAPVAPVPSFKPAPSAPRTPSMPKTPRFAGIMGALRKPKIGI